MPKFDWTPEELDDMLFLVNHGFTYQQVGENYDISRQRVHQLIGDKVTAERMTHFHGDYRGLVDALGTDKDINIAKRFGLSCGVVTRLRNKYGIPKYYKPPGCDKCSTNHYACGFCKSCYARLLRLRERSKHNA